MIDYQTTLFKLNANLNTLRERESKYAGDAPIALLNEISDHRSAIALTEQLRAGQLSESDWREALRPLNIDHTLIEDSLLQKALKALSLPTDQQRELRNRQIMLQRVHDFWVKGVLESSLYNEVLIELGMKTRPEAVEYPWEMVIERPDQRDRTLPPGTQIIDVFDESGGSLLVLGEPGSGKTTMLLELTRELISRIRQDFTQPMPIVFNLSTWAEAQPPLNEWLAEDLNSKYYIPKEVAQSHRAACVEAINTLTKKPSFVQDGCNASTILFEFRSNYLILTFRMGVFSPLNLACTDTSTPAGIVTGSLWLPIDMESMKVLVPASATWM